MRSTKPTLPAPGADESLAPGLAHATPRADAPLVLVVDDSEDNRDLYATYFEFAGLRVALACDGEEALAKLAPTPPDVVIMDLSMPRMDGWEATRIIKGNPRTQRIPVIVLSAHAMKEDIDRARAAGADVVCAKPCVPQDLLDLVRAAIARSGGDRW